MLSIRNLTERILIVPSHNQLFIIITITIETSMTCWLHLYKIKVMLMIAKNNTSIKINWTILEGTFIGEKKPFQCLKILTIIKLIKDRYRLLVYHSPLLKQHQRKSRKWIFCNRIKNIPTISRSQKKWQTW